MMKPPELLCARYVRSYVRALLAPGGAQEPKRPPGGAKMPGAPGSSPKKPIMCKICAELCACAVVVTLGAPLLLDDLRPSCFSRVYRACWSTKLS